MSYEDPPDYPSHPCPRCGRDLPAGGELRIGDVLIPMYQCDHCVRPVGDGQDALNLPLTFIVDPRTGIAVDPNDPESDLGEERV